MDLTALAGCKLPSRTTLIPEDKPAEKTEVTTSDLALSDDILSFRHLQR